MRHRLSPIDREQWAWHAVQLERYSARTGESRLSGAPSAPRINEARLPPAPELIECDYTREKRSWASCPCIAGPMTAQNREVLRQAQARTSSAKTPTLTIISLHVPFLLLCRFAHVRSCHFWWHRGVDAAADVDKTPTHATRHDGRTGISALSVQRPGPQAGAGRGEAGLLADAGRRTSDLADPNDAIAARR